MSPIRTIRRTVQSGFTLIELIVVIVILGILAAVAVPQFTDQSANATKAVEDATLGALKSAWSAAYAEKQGKNPTVDDVAKKMLDPKCEAQTDGSIKCGSMTFKSGQDAASKEIDSPAKITK